MAMMELTADRRQYTGKETNRKRRAEGKIPGVIYGKGLETRSIEFQRKPLEKFIDTARRGTVIVKMTVQDGAGGKETFAVLKETQTHPLTGRVTHVDFYEVALGEEVPRRGPAADQGEGGRHRDGRSPRCGHPQPRGRMHARRRTGVSRTRCHLPRDRRFASPCGRPVPRRRRPHREGSSDDPGGGPARRRPKPRRWWSRSWRRKAPRLPAWRSPERRKRSRKRKRRSRKRNRRRRSSAPRDSSSDWGIRGAGTAPRSTMRGSWRSTGSPNRWVCGGARAPRPRWEPARSVGGGSSSRSR